MGARAVFAVYASSLALTTTAVTAGLLLTAPHDTLRGWGLGAAIVVLLIAASQLTVALLHWAVTLLVRPKILPRLDFSSGIPREHRAVVAVPAMLTDPDEVDHLLESMEIRFLANRDPSLAFVLVSDFRDAPREKMEGDDALLARAVERVQALNARYAEGPPSAGPFYLFHRSRRLNKREGVWMGWERKRGKLEELNAALRGQPSGFDTIVGDPARLGDAKYVIVLDSDTRAPPRFGPASSWASWRTG